MPRRIGQLARRTAARLLAPVGRAPRAVVAVACLVVLVMFCTNHDMGGDDRSPRGDGKYRPVLARGDGHMMYLMARSTVFDRDWNFDNDLARFGDPWNQPRTPTGRKGIPHPIGPPLVWAPVLALAHAGAVVANLFGADIEDHGYTLWHQRIVFLTSALFACGAVLLGRRVARDHVGGAWAGSYAAVIVLLGTSLTYYATYMPSYAHAMDAFASAGFLAYWIATLGRRDLRRWLGLGVLLGLATLVRIQELALGVVVAIEICVRLGELARVRDAGWAREAARWVGGGALVLAVTGVLFIPQLVAWQVVFGDWHGLPQGRRYTRLGSPLVLETLFSSRNGWITTTPLVYLGLAGLACLPRKARLVAVGLGAAVLVQIYLASTIFDWWGSASFGQRRLCNLTLPLVVGTAALFWRLSRAAARLRRAPRWTWHAVAIVLVGPFLAWNLRSVGRLTGGKAANASAAPSCCDQVPPGLRGAARWLYDRVGNPFALPASVVFSLRHGVDLARWDRAVGDYPLVPNLDALHDGTMNKITGTWPIGNGGRMDTYVIEGLSRAQKADRAFRWTTAATARVLVPNLMPDAQRMGLWLAAGGSAHVRVSYAGRVVAEVELASTWKKIEFDVAAPPVGTNELAIEAALGPLETSPLPPFSAPVGVAVGALELRFAPGVK